MDTSAWIDCNGKIDNLKDVGYSYYLAPEIIAERSLEETSLEFDPRCDVWSVGVLLYIMLCGKAPFDGGSDAEITENIKIGEITFAEPIWEEISEDGKKLIRKMLTHDYKKRITAKEALKDKWFSSKVERKSINPELMKQALSNMQAMSYSSKLQQATM